MDLYLAYLRAAFNCCYYCSAITDHIEELQRKCVKHIRRRPASSVEPLRDERWEESLDQKTSLLIDRDNVDPREHGGKSLEECVQLSFSFSYDLPCTNAYPTGKPLVQSSLISSKRTRASSDASHAPSYSRPRVSLRSMWSRGIHSLSRLPLKMSVRRPAGALLFAPN